MEKVQWIVEGMTCSNCALTVNNYLQKQGMEQVKVNPLNGEVSFQLAGTGRTDQLITGIGSLGYQVVQQDGSRAVTPKRIFSNHKQRFAFCLVFTLPLMMHMLDRWIHIHWLMNPYVQLALCLPVFIVGMDFFGRSAIQSIRNGLSNMNVLVSIGAIASFAYSFTGTLLQLGDAYLFYETTASIITLVFLGNYLEDTAIRTTQSSIRKLSSSQKVMANMIAFDGDHQELVFPIENTALKHGDLVLIKSGEQVPADGKILWGDASIDESIVTGESLPVEKHAKDTVIGGSILTDGTLRVMVTAEAKDSVLSKIIDLVKQAQGEKMEIRKLADRISAIFVPLVLAISLLTFIVNFFIFGTLAEPLLRSIAVLVIACPCAMGLATPAAIAVGLGRAARSGILFRHAQSLELFKDIKQVVFDKTGTLTTGNFSISKFKIVSSDVDEAEFQRILFSLEKYSNHPIAKTITNKWRVKNEIRWNKVEEEKGIGMRAVDRQGNIFRAGSYKIIDDQTTDQLHNVYLLINNKLIGWVDLSDEIRPEAKSVIGYLNKSGIKTILLSGDKLDRCNTVGAALGIDEVIGEKTPKEKAEIIESLNQVQPTAMIGDGINDAPALAKATIGISMGDASQIAIETGDVILMNKGLKNLPLALGLGKHTFLTIKQNLFWAFIYNIIAIPVAAVGLLTPTFGALVMGLSDIVLAANSVRLSFKKVA
ncbi:MAG: cation-translocating P-type ATPase [Flavitalea sp.]